MWQNKKLNWTEQQTRLTPHTLHLNSWEHQLSINIKSNYCDTQIETPLTFAVKWDCQSKYIVVSLTQLALLWPLYVIAYWLNNIVNKNYYPWFRFHKKWHWTKGIVSIFLLAALSFHFCIFPFVSLRAHLHLRTHCISSHSLIPLYNPAFAPSPRYICRSASFFVTCFL